jgi:hypothetical protein
LRQPVDEVDRIADNLVCLMGEIKTESLDVTAMLFDGV